MPIDPRDTPAFSVRDLSDTRRQALDEAIAKAQARAADVRATSWSAETALLEFADDLRTLRAKE